MGINGQTLLNFFREGKYVGLTLRTDNAIKNHFYSKLRKFIRKILKAINKDNMLKTNAIDPNKYNSDKIYKLIKKFKVPYNTLTKDSILTMIVNFEKNSKLGKSEGHGFLKHKTLRKKSKEKENLYSEKVNKRTQRKTKAVKEVPVGNVYAKVRNTTNTTRSQRTRKRKELYDDNTYELGYRKSYFNILGPTTTSRRRDYQQDAEYISSLSNNSRDNGEVIENNGNISNLNIIIDKSILFQHYVKSEEEKSKTLSGVPSVERSEKHEFVYDNRYMIPTNGASEYSNSNMLLFNKNPFDCYVDYNPPLVSPINYRTQIFPMSTKNHFNIDMMINHYDYNKGSYIKSPVVEKKEVNMQNKILINEVAEMTESQCKEETLTPTFKKMDELFPEMGEKNVTDTTALERRASKAGKRLSIDLDVINKDTDTNKFFVNPIIYPEEEVKEVVVPVVLTSSQESLTRHVEDNTHEIKKPMPIVSPNNLRTCFSISPKSAFMFTRK
jgi:hypothetical protein